MKWLRVATISRGALERPEPLEEMECEKADLGLLRDEQGDGGVYFSSAVAKKQSERVLLPWEISEEDLRA